MPQIKQRIFHFRRRRANKLPPLGLHCKYRNDLEHGGGAKVVKGTTRRVVVVKSPDPKLFEQAIFILREDIFSDGGVSADRLMEEAREIAAGYTGKGRGLHRHFSRLPTLAVAALGAALTGLVWLAVYLLA